MKASTGGAGKREGKIQILAALEMFIVVQEIGSPFTPCAVIYTVVLAGLGGFELAEGMGEGFGGGFFIRGRLGRRFFWLDGLRPCRCMAEGPLEK